MIKNIEWDVEVSRVVNYCMGIQEIHVQNLMDSARVNSRNFLDVLA